MAFTYILNYMDKVALSEASIFGLQKDLVGGIQRLIAASPISD